MDTPRGNTEGKLMGITALGDRPAQTIRGKEILVASELSVMTLTRALSPHQILLTRTKPDTIEGLRQERKEGGGGDANGARVTGLLE